MKKVFLLSLIVLFSSAVFADRLIMAAPQQSTDTVISGSFTNNQANDGADTSSASDSPIATQLQIMQKSITDLRGLIEIQGHQIEQLQVNQQILESAIAQKSGNKINKTTPVQSNLAVDSSAQQTPVANAANNQGQSDYQYAFQLISKKQYAKAINGMEAYLTKYPNGQSAASAHYWLGELYAIAGNEKKALAQFNDVINNYSDSSKAPDAMLKLGVIAYGNNQYQQAKAWFGKITKKYPNSSVARIAAQQQLQLEKAGY